MNEPTAEPPDPRDHPAVRNYTVLCLAALLIVVLVLVEAGYGVWGLLPGLVGAFALVVHWGLGPPLTLLTLVFVVVSQGRWLLLRYRLESDFFSDLALCVAALAYAAGFYRLQSLVRYAFPPAPRERGRPGEAPDAGRRRPDLADPAELVTLLVALPVWAVIAYLVWLRLEVETPLFGTEQLVWWGVLLVWILGLGLAGTAAVIGYLGWTQRSPEESLLYLQDVVFRETRTEQVRINRWLVWARRRRERKEKR